MERTLNELAKLLYQAKQAESAAKSDRIEIEELIAQQVQIDGDKGSKTVDAGDGLKITVERKLNYKADVAGMREMDARDIGSAGAIALPLKHVPASWAFDATAYEKLRKDSPAVAAQLAGFVTVTPAKTSVSIKMA